MILDVKLKRLMAKVSPHRLSNMTKPDCWIEITILADVIENRACENSE
jgi:hypothetical protein